MNWKGVICNEKMSFFLLTDTKFQGEMSFEMVKTRSWTVVAFHLNHDLSYRHFASINIRSHSFNKRSKFFSYYINYCIKALSLLLLREKSAYLIRWAFVVLKCYYHKTRQRSHCILEGERRLTYSTGGRA